jgi:tetratricopeptide (TPR) repeat protein
LNYRLLPFFFFYLFIALRCYCEEPSSNLTPATSNLVIQNLTTTYKFTQEAVWAHLTATIRDHQNGFSLVVISDTAMTGWILRNAGTNEVVQKGGLGNQKTFTTEISKPFKDGYRLTIFAKEDQDQVPVILNLAPDESYKEKNGISGSSIPDFEENPDHAYNAMVKSLYKQAAQAYSTGDKSSALTYLNKAVDLDPTQTQVQSFRQLILAGADEIPQGEQTTPGVTSSKERPDDKLSSTENADDLAARAKKAELNGDLLKARTFYEKALNLKPNEPDWSSKIGLLNRKLALEKFKIALKEKNLAEARTAFEKLKALDPNNPQLPDWKKQLDSLQSPSIGDDSQAQADQFYNMGLESYRNNDYAGAKKYWQEALKLQPNHQQAANNLQRLIDEHPELK